MTNTILAFASIAIVMIVLVVRPSRAWSLGALGVVFAITLFAAFTAVEASNNAPALGIAAFVGSFAFFALFSRWKKK